jgi:hypothetical protein
MEKLEKSAGDNTGKGGEMAHGEGKVSVGHL